MKLIYRPEIDGLWAIAVLSVIFYHAEFILFNQKILQGGFLGVDIFFVISGYLISSILLKEYYKDKKISLSNFYKRRIRRIIPALLIVTLFSSLLSFYFLLPESLIKFAKTIIFSISFLSNMFFWHSQTVYGAEESFLSPLLHTWSLSVEEQFYIFYPLLLIIITSLLKKYFFLMIALIFSLSFTLSVVGNLLVPSFNFFVLPTRIWEFLAGGMIAYLEINKLTKFKKTNYHNILGFLIILISVFYFNDELEHPSFLTLLPVLGSCLIIYNASIKIDFIKKILSYKFLLFIGLISYSLYLWHFPLFSFLKHLGLYENNSYKILVIFLTIILSFFTYRYIEQFFRNKKFSFLKVLILIFFSSIFLIGYSYKIIENNGYEKRLKKDLSKFQLNFLDQKNDTPINLLKNSELSSTPDTKLKNVLIVGNSHGFDLFASLSTNKRFREKYNFNLLQGQVHCMEESIKKKNKVCVRILQFKHREQFKRRLENYYKSDIVIIKTRWSDKDVKSLDSLLKFFKKDNKQILVFSSNPEFNFTKTYSNELKTENILKKILYQKSDYIDRFIISKNRMPNDNEIKKINNNYFLSLNNEILKRDKMIEKISSENNIKYFDFKNLICNFKEQECTDLTFSKKKVYTDKSGHLSTDASRETSNQIFDNGIMN